MNSYAVAAKPLVFTVNFKNLIFTIKILHNTLLKPLLVLAARRLRQNLPSQKVGSSDHNSLVQILVNIWFHSDFLDTTPHEMGHEWK